MAAAVIGYLGKHNATLSGAEGGCQAEIGVASSMGAALIAQAHDAGISGGEGSSVTAPGEVTAEPAPKKSKE